MASIVKPLSADKIRKKNDERKETIAKYEIYSKIKNDIKTELQAETRFRMDDHTFFPKIMELLKKKLILDGESWVNDDLITCNIPITNISNEISYKTRTSRNRNINEDSNSFFGLVKLPSLNSLSNIHLYNIDPTFNPDFSKCADSVVPVSLNDFILSNRLEEYYNNDNIHAIFTVGSLQRYVYAIVGIDGIVYFPPLISYIYSRTVDDADKILKYIEKPILFQILTKKKYSEDTSLLTKDLLTVALIKLMREQNNRLTYQTVNDIIREMRRIITSFFKSPWIVNSNNNSIDAFSYAMLTNQARVYKDGILKILTHSDSTIKKAYMDGLNVGMKLFSNIVKCGYTMDERSGKWFKEINILPSKCFWSGRLYSIKKIHRKWELTKLYIDPTNFQASELRVEAIGNHPNVNCSVVCLGDDLKEKWRRIIACDASELDPDAIPYFFNQIEETLKIINFDSAYEKINETLRDEGLEIYNEDHTTKTSFRGKTWIELD